MRTKKRINRRNGNKNNTAMRKDEGRREGDVGRIWRELIARRKWKQVLSDGMKAGREDEQEQGRISKGRPER